MACAMIQVCSYDSVVCPELVMLFRAVLCLWQILLFFCCCCDIEEFPDFLEQEILV